MNRESPTQLSPEVMALQNLLVSSRQTSQELWDSVDSALNAADAAVATSVAATESQLTRVTSASDTTSASRMEDCYG